MSYYIDKKFINLASVNLSQFKWKKEDLANCRCPICGDSQKNKTKARGYFYKKKNDFFYKCHNCDVGLSLYRFLEEVSPSLTKEYSVERWKAGENGNSNYVKPDENKMFGLSFKPKFKPISKYLDELIPIYKLPKDHPAYKFCKLRHIPEKHYGILYYTDNFGEFMLKLDPDSLAVGKEERLIIPFFNEPRNKQIVNYNDRLITKGCSVCIWPSDLEEKDINDMIYSKTVKEIKNIIDDNTYSGLEARLQFRNWRKV